MATIMFVGMSGGTRSNRNSQPHYRLSPPYLENLLMPVSIIIYTYSPRFRTDNMALDFLLILGKVMACNSSQERLDIVKNFYKSQRMFQGNFKLSELEFLTATCSGFAPRTCTQIYYRPETCTYIFKLTDERFTVIGKLYPVRKQEYHSLEIGLLKKFSDLVIKDKTPHITLPLCRFILPREIAHQWFPEAKLESVSQLLVSEYADKGTLTDLLNQEQISPLELKNILFQVFYTLAKIMEIEPDFRHLDLHIGNVLIQTDPCRGYRKYTLDSKTQFYQRSRYRVLMWDMYFSQKNAALSVFRDTHELIDSLLYVLLNRSKKFQIRMKRIIEFCSILIPEPVRCMSATPSRHPDTLNWEVVSKKTPADILRDAYFSELLLRPKTGSLQESFR